MYEICSVKTALWLLERLSHGFPMTEGSALQFVHHAVYSSGQLSSVLSRCFSASLLELDTHSSTMKI